VELCKVALWLEAHTPGEPLNFLDHHIKCGNAIVGFARREEAERGVPDEAFTALPDDDKDIAALLRKRNKKEREDHAAGQLPLSDNLQKQLDDILRGWNELNTLPEHTPDEIEAKKARYLAFTQSKDAWLLHQIASIPIAQFYLPKTAGNLQKFVTDATYRRYWKGEVSPQGQATAEAWAMAERKRFFHWFLEFPEIIERGGFDCILGNPPYLGNRALSGNYGDAFLHWVKYAFAPAGSVDLVTYFFRRIFDLLRSPGHLALISTKTIAQGAAREGGLEVIAKRGGVVNFAVHPMKWPGKAAVDVSLVAICNGNWSGLRWLNGRPVGVINAFLESEESAGSAQPLISNIDRSFVGSYVLGGGFILKEMDARRLLDESPQNCEVVFPYLIGDDLNSRPDQSPSRWVINFFDWTEDHCADTYPNVFEVIRDKVMPERTRRDENGEFVLRKIARVERYHEHRRALMKSLWLGLTDIYNLFHTRDLTPAEVARVSKKPLPEAEAGYQGILELRRLHRELDLAIRDAYGWTDLDLGHDFIEVETLPENDRVRYTISPAARKEVLKRLLALNHQRAAAEAAAVAVAVPANDRCRGRAFSCRSHPVTATGRPCLGQCCP
jgi:hypothetical protein